MICAFLGHRPGGGVLRNGTLEFGSCARCGCDLVRRPREAWRRPIGHRIVWPPGTGPDAAFATRKGPRKAAPPADEADAKLVGRIRVYLPAPDEPDFMASADQQPFDWERPYAGDAANPDAPHPARFWRRSARRGGRG